MLVSSISGFAGDSENIPNKASNFDQGSCPVSESPRSGTVTPGPPRFVDSSKYLVIFTTSDQSLFGIAVTSLYTLLDLKLVLHLGLVLNVAFVLFSLE